MLVMSENKEAFLSRWSRLKLETEEFAKPIESPAVLDQPAADAQPAEGSSAELPPVESITVQSDISPYLQATVDAGLKRMALKKLFQDPHFHFVNMDKLDIYIDDYGIADPLPEGMLEQLKFAQDYIFKDPTKPEAELAASPEAESAAAGLAPPADAAEGEQKSADSPADSLDKMSHAGAMPPGGDDNA